MAQAIPSYRIFKWRVEKYSDEEFIQAVEEFNSMEGYLNKIELLCANSDNYEGLIEPLIRVINGKEYKYGFEITNKHDAERIGNYIVDKFKFDWIEKRKEDLLQRLLMCVSNLEKIELLESEIDEIHNKVSLGSNKENDKFVYEKYYTIGYKHEKSKKPLEFLRHGPLWVSVPNREFNLGVLMMIAQGAVASMLERHIKLLLSQGIPSYEPHILIKGRGGNDSIVPDVLDDIDEFPNNNSHNDGDSIEMGMNPKFDESSEDAECESELNVDVEEVVAEYIGCFAGYNKRKNAAVLSQEEYKRVFEYTVYLIKEKELPQNIKPVRPNLSGEFIRKTFQLLHHKIYGKDRQKVWYLFIQSVFLQCKNWSLDFIEKKFTSYEKNDYQTDKKAIVMK